MKTEYNFTRVYRHRPTREKCDLGSTLESRTVDYQSPDLDQNTIRRMAKVGKVAESSFLLYNGSTMLESNILKGACLPNFYSATSNATPRVQVISENIHHRTVPIGTAEHVQSVI